MANGIPSPRVFARLDPRDLHRRFGHCVAAACEAVGLIAIAISIDGKSARSAKWDTATVCLRMVTVWAVESRLLLGATDALDDSIEVAAIPELLRTLD